MRRPQRIAELLREGVTQIVGYELADPRVAGVTVTDVRVADNNRDARVFVTIVGSDEEAREALAALRRAASFVRRQLGLTYDLPHVPLLHFVRDTVEERATRVDELLMDLERAGAFKPPASEGVEAGEDVEEGDAPPDAVSRTRSNR